MAPVVTLQRTIPFFPGSMPYPCRDESREWLPPSNTGGLYQLRRRPEMELIAVGTAILGVAYTLKYKRRLYRLLEGRRSIAPALSASCIIGV